MSNVLRVVWTIASQIAPRPRLNCNRCGGARPFRSSDKFRMNANGKRLDAWLVYNCVACGNSWNRTIFERRNLRDVDRPTLHALQTNAPDLVRRIAFDIEGVRGGSQRVEEFAAMRMEKQVLSKGSSPIARIEIAIVAPQPTGLRVDRLLAAEFAVSRARIHALEAKDASRYRLMEVACFGGRSRTGCISESKFPRRSKISISGEPLGAQDQNHAGEAISPLFVAIHSKVRSTRLHLSQQCCPIRPFRGGP